MFKTYSFLLNNKSSDGYYKDVEIITDKIIEKSDRFIKDVIKDFNEFLQTVNLRRNINKPEAILECLILGTLWNIYLPSEKLNLLEKLLIKLNKMRREYLFLKKYIDFTKGILATILINKKSNSPVVNKDNMLKLFKRLILRLKANGDYWQEISRLKIWYDFFSSLPSDKRFSYLNRSLKFAQWFKKISLTYLGKYTTNVKNYLENYKKDHNLKEDIIFCGRKEVEYHINMTGAEILNRVYKSAFEKAKNKQILLPTCMRIKQRKCKAVKKPFGFKCSHCNSNCNVSKVTKLANQNNCDVFIISHESMLFSKNAKKSVLGEDIAIIGVACVLNLISGGWKAAKMDIPPQCVLLDYCGCKKHWDEKGKVTTINMGRLKKVLAGGSND